MDTVAAGLFLPLAFWIALSGADDLIVDVAALIAWFRHRSLPRPARRTLLAAPQSRIAIFVPCWHEDGVIESMVERNVESVRYAHYDFFIGVYPNDEATIAAVARLEERYANVHVAVCPHDGPTSKADCLNQTWQRMLLFEAHHGVRFDLVVTHDAEDVIHPDALQWLNWHGSRCDMVQIPVLPLPLPVRHQVYGIYCDEFAEYQARDMPARLVMGAFLPSNGVGTGFRRDTLDALAEAECNRLFEPACLTEDYENGLRLKSLGASQYFVPMHQDEIATREYFPRTFRTAVRQRTRWITGIALQTWERHVWAGAAGSKYWLWRDRKGLIGNPASLAANFLSAYGLFTYAWCSVSGVDWGLGQAVGRYPELLLTTSGLALYRQIYRGICVGRIYGPVFALALPVRTVVANAVNTAATLSAVRRFLWSKLRREPLRWVKTEHQFPNALAFAAVRPKLGQVLVANGYISEACLARALDTRPPGVRIGEHLIALGLLEEDSLYEALSIQTGYAQESVDPRTVRPSVARSLPARILEHWGVIPVRMEPGRIVLAGPEIPAEGLEAAVRRCTTLKPQFRLVTPKLYRALVEELLLTTSGPSRS